MRAKWRKKRMRRLQRKRRKMRARWPRRRTSASGAYAHGSSSGDFAPYWLGHNELMRLLIYSGFNPKQKDNYGQTVLHLACINGNLQAVKDLCEQDGVDVDQADNNGKTPLMLAIGRKHDSLVSYLKKEIHSRNSLLPRIDCWSIIFGPPGNTKAALIFFLVTVVLWGYPMYLIKCLPVTWNDLQAFHVLFMCTNVIMWICLYHSNSIDPGFLPRNIPEYDLAIKQEIRSEKAGGSIPQTEEERIPKPQGRRELKNIFTRMESMSGPLSLLTRCVNNKEHVRVVTRGAVTLSSVCRGYIVAFDKYCNMTRDKAGRPGLLSQLVSLFCLGQ
ncbi:hypothetical protein EGW08_020123 [Elysia chlorotica]|uniref:60S ribosomal protein L41 n=1 Tax=Elysia chlorotica TaxID=188477 RepID=A0A3S0ZD25_ELYCH|nr:hypothetical protein EGW08_020123 [Elysia chlorotica]